MCKARFRLPNIIQMDAGRSMYNPRREHHSQSIAFTHTAMQLSYNANQNRHRIPNTCMKNNEQCTMHNAQRFHSSIKASVQRLMFIDNIVHNQMRSHCWPLNPKFSLESNIQSKSVRMKIFYYPTYIDLTLKWKHKERNRFKSLRKHFDAIHLIQKAKSLDAKRHLFMISYQLKCITIHRQCRRD